MLRKMRVDGPAERLDDLVRAARRAGLELDDYAVDLSTEYGWPGRGDGHAYVLAVVDDDWQSVSDLVMALRAAHEATAYDAADWITPGGSFVYLPDAMEPEWYDTVVPFAEALHAAEQDADAARVATLRAELVGLIGAVVPLADRRFAAFTTFVAGPIRGGQPDPRGGK
ncbi:MAG: hypothetical protein ACOH17_13465 [Cellulomonas sp.]